MSRTANKILVLSKIRKTGRKCYFRKKFYVRQITLAFFQQITLNTQEILSLSLLGLDCKYLLRSGTSLPDGIFNPLNVELNPICYLLALLGAHHFLHVSRIRVKSLTLRLLMSYIYIYMEHLFLMFLDHTQRRTTVGRTPLDE